jgi:hypothetical protein
MLIGTHKGQLCQEGMGHWPGGFHGVAGLSLTVLLANLAVASFGHLVQVIRYGLKKIQYQPGLIEGCLAGQA